MKLEIIVVRDPDGDTDLLFFLDGQPVDAQGGPLEIVDLSLIHI